MSEIKKIQFEDELMLIFRNEFINSCEMLYDKIMSSESKINDKQIIASRIKKRRIELKLKQKIVAEQMGVSPTCVTRMEGGKYHISIPMLKKLCSVLKCESTDILNF